MACLIGMMPILASAQAQGASGVPLQEGQEVFAFDGMWDLFDGLITESLRVSPKAETPTDTPTDSLTPTETSTSTITPTFTITLTPTITFTRTPTRTATVTVTPIPACPPGSLSFENCLEKISDSEWLISSETCELICIDHDIVIPEGVTLTLKIAAPDDHLILNFTPVENSDCGGLCNNVAGKCELIVAGALRTEVVGPNKVLLTSEAQGKSEKGVFSPDAGNWAGIYVLDRSDDSSTRIENCEIRNALVGVRFIGSSGLLRNCLIENCLNVGVVIRDRSFPLIEGNTILNNGFGGISVNRQSSPSIAGNIVTGHEDGVGVTVSDYSAPVFTDNTITGNGAGVLAQTNSAPNLGRVSFDPENDPEPDVDPPFTNDEGANTLSFNINNLGQTVNLINNTPNKVYAENNNWGLSVGSEIDATIWDDDEATLVPGLVSNPGPVDFVPIQGEPPLPTITETPTSSATRTSTPTRTSTRTATLDPSIPTKTPTESSTPTETGTPTLPQSPTVTPTETGSPTDTRTIGPTATPIQIAPRTPTPTATQTPLPGSLFQNVSLSGLIHLATDVMVQPGVTLTILPGSTVMLENGARIIVKPQGRLIAEGEQDNKINFLAPPAQFWSGIEIQGPDLDADPARSSLRYCTIQGATSDISGVTVTALNLIDVHAVVEHCEFKSCQTAIRVAGGPLSYPRIRRNVFRNYSSAIVVDVTGTISPVVEPGGFFNLGRDDETDFAQKNLDPGFNIFVQPIQPPPFGPKDLDVESFYTGKTLEAMDNLFLVDGATRTYTRMTAPEVTASNRTAGPVSIDEPPILSNVTEISLPINPALGIPSAVLVQITDDEVWAGFIPVPPTRIRVEVVEGVDLTIFEGSSVQFKPSFVSITSPSYNSNVHLDTIKPTLRVYGHLLALGSRPKPILFDGMPEVGDPEFAWGGLEFVGPDPEDEQPSQLRFAEIRHAEVGAAFFAGVRTEIENVLIEDCGETSVAAVNAQPAFFGASVKSGAAFKSNSAALNARGLSKVEDPFQISKPSLRSLLMLSGQSGQYGLLSEDAEPKLRNSAIGVDARNNTYALHGFSIAGVLVSGAHVPNLGTAQDRGQNLIFGHETLEYQYEVINNSKTSVEALGNYWNDVDADSIDYRIFDDDENQAAGVVMFSPYLLWPPAFDPAGGNLDEDSYVLPNDLTILLAAYLTVAGEQGFNPLADLNGDQVVDAEDVFIMSLIYSQRNTSPHRVFPVTPTVTGTATVPPTATATRTITATATPTKSPTSP